MGDDAAKEAWESVGEQAKDLGESFKAHYDSGEGEGASDEVKEALHTVGQGLERLFSAIGSAIRDPEVQDKAKAAGSSMLDAIGRTLNAVADEVRDVFDRRSGGAAEETETVEVEEPEEDAEAAAHRELDDADAVEEIQADLEEDAEE